MKLYLSALLEAILFISDHACIVSISMGGGGGGGGSPYRPVTLLEVKSNHTRNSYQYCDVLVCYHSASLADGIEQLECGIMEEEEAELKIGFLHRLYRLRNRDWKRPCSQWGTLHVVLG